MQETRDCRTKDQCSYVPSLSDVCHLGDSYRYCLEESKDDDYATFVYCEARTIHVEIGEDATLEDKSEKQCKHKVEDEGHKDRIRR